MNQNLKSPVILAFDYGTKRIGVAVTSDDGKYVKPLDVIKNNFDIIDVEIENLKKNSSEPKDKQIKLLKKQKEKKLHIFLNKVFELVSRYYPDVILIGMPSTVDKVYKKKILKFANEIKKFLNKKKVLLDIQIINEDLTSHDGLKELNMLGFTKKNIDDLIDSYSAMYIIKTYNDKYAYDISKETDK
ncbi:MAG: Holliday junction resolvase RuvX [Candidatus Dojkabacteria bacterium]|nr:Holliday junction resolvase RuvX [Candidatus Dojkabacteria bacterium]